MDTNVLNLQLLTEVEMRETDGGNPLYLLAGGLLGVILYAAYHVGYNDATSLFF